MDNTLPKFYQKNTNQNNKILPRTSKKAKRPIPLRIKTADVHMGMGRRNLHLLLLDMLIAQSLEKT